MKTLRGFCAGIAILLAVLMVVYLVTLYVKFKPDEQKKENGKGKPVQFLEAAAHNRIYLRLLFFVCLSAAVCLILKKAPAAGAVSAVLLLAFVGELFSASLLTKRPMVISVFLLVHALANIALCAVRDRFTSSRNCAWGSGLCLGAAGLMTGAAAYFQNVFSKSAEAAAELEEASITVVSKVRAFPELMDTVVRIFRNEGDSAARGAASDFALDLNIGQLQTSFFGSINEEQLSDYKKLLLVILASAVIALALRRRLPVVSAAVSFLPFVWCAFAIPADKMSTLALPIMITSLGAGLLAAGSVQRGLGRDPAEESEPEPEDAPASGADDEIYYT